MQKSSTKKNNTEKRRALRAFERTVWEYYLRHGRRSLPWRKTKNAYRILVSEIMLQQTQVDRVIPKYRAFLIQFPSLASLARAPLGDVLRAWQGLGYNRRAKMLHLCAQTVLNEHKGKLPRIEAELIKLPGIGTYTAGAVCAFAYNIPVTIIETNIRTVFIHHFFNDEVDVSDAKLLPLIRDTVDHQNPREWYYALMDYGAHLKKTVGNQNIRSKHYVKQSPFKNSDRQIRGAIIRALSEKNATRAVLHKALPFEHDRIDAALARLTEEEMVLYTKGAYQLP